MKQARHESNLVWKWKKDSFEFNILQFPSLPWYEKRFHFLFDLSLPFVRLKMINENQPNHSIKLAFISLVCFFSFLFPSRVLFVFFASQKGVCAKNGSENCEEGKNQGDFYCWWRYLFFTPIQPIHFSQSQREGDGARSETIIFHLLVSAFTAADFPLYKGEELFVFGENL